VTGAKVNGRLHQYCMTPSVSWFQTVKPFWVLPQQVMIGVAVVTSGTMKRVQIIYSWLQSDLHQQQTNT